MRALRIFPLTLAPAFALLAGCTPDEQYIVVTVQARPAVHDVAMLRVTLSNAGSMRTEDLSVGGATFPATFSISPEDRTGDLGIAIEAYSADSELVGRGTVQSTIEMAAAAVQLEPTDFVVNTEYAGSQELSNYAPANGLQLAATQSGTWTATYSADCLQPCNVFGRRFDVAARPVSSVVAAGTAGFPISTQLTTSFSTPAIAANTTTTVAVWNHRDSVAATYSIQCRALDERGAAASSQQLIATDTFPYMVAATALPSGNFALVWPGRVTTNTIIRAAIVSPMCTPIGAVATLSPDVASVYPSGSHVAANATGILYAWKLDGSIRGRLARLDGTVLGAADIPLVTKTATEQIEHVRVAPLGNDFAVLVRWDLITGSTGPGRIELYRVSSAGVVMGSPILVTDRSGTDYASSEGFGVAPRSDGTMLVVWHACMDRGDGNGCGVFGRLLDASGAPAAPDFSLATTTTGDQTRPSAVALPDGAFATAWSDKSGAAPDMSETAVRARIVYPVPGGAAQ